MHSVVYNITNAVQLIVSIMVDASGSTTLVIFYISHHAGGLTQIYLNKEDALKGDTQRPVYWSWLVLFGLSRPGSVEHADILNRPHDVFKH